MMDSTTKILSMCSPNVSEAHEGDYTVYVWNEYENASISFFFTVQGKTDNDNDKDKIIMIIIRTTTTSTILLFSLIYFHFQQDKIKYMGLHFTFFLIYLVPPQSFISMDPAPIRLFNSTINGFVKDQMYTLECKSTGKPKPK